MAINVIDRYARGEITEDECAAWADVLHGRDDVELDPPDKDRLWQMLFEFSTPELFEPLTPAFAARWRARLTQLQANSGT
jgi:hypothetical protein